MTLTTEQHEHVTYVKGRLTKRPYASRLTWDNDEIEMLLNIIDKLDVRNNQLESHMDSEPFRDTPALFRVGQRVKHRDGRTGTCVSVQDVAIVVYVDNSYGTTEQWLFADNPQPLAAPVATADGATCDDGDWFNVGERVQHYSGVNTGTITSIEDDMVAIRRDATGDIVWSSIVAITHYYDQPQPAPTVAAGAVRLTLSKGAIAALCRLNNRGGEVIHERDANTYGHSWGELLSGDRDKWHNSAISESVFKQIRPYLTVDDENDITGETVYLPNWDAIGRFITEHEAALASR